MIGETKVVKVVMLGDSGVGKTTIFSQLHDRQPPTHSSSPEFGMKLYQVGGRKVKLQMWDVNLENCQYVVPTYFKNVSIFVVVCDVTRKETLQRIQEWAQMIDDKSTKYRIIVVCNKVDLSYKRAFRKISAFQCAEIIGAKYMEISALENIGIEELKTHILEIVYEDFVGANGGSENGQECFRCIVL
jgi:small GTP-binding protein